MYRRVWTVEEIANILRAVAMQGGDKNTLAILAVALGIYADYGAQTEQLSVKKTNANNGDY